jgi:RNA polymerase sigma-70 factor (ECF subfamily)
MDPGKETEYVRLLSEYDGELRRYLYTLLPKMADVEEVLQETALALWEKFDQYDPDRPFKPWACRFAYFQTLRFRRSAAQDRLVFREEVLELVAAEREQEEPALEQRRIALGFCLGKLPQADCDLLGQRYAEERKIVDLARQWGQPVKQLYNKLDRIRARLALCIEERMAATGSS